VTPDDAHTESLRPVFDAVADADWAQARDVLLGDMATFLRQLNHDGGYNCPAYLRDLSCRGCDLILRYEEDVPQPPTRILNEVRARFGDLGGGTA
jgi:hypothetical protein